MYVLFPPSIIVKCRAVVLRVVLCGVVLVVSCVVMLWCCSRRVALFLLCVCVCDLFLFSQVDSSLSRLHASRRLFGLLADAGLDSAVIHHYRPVATDPRELALQIGMLPFVLFLVSHKLTIGGLSFCFFFHIN